MSDWIIAMESFGLRELAKAFHSDKLQDYKRLKESGLPTFDDFIIQYKDFNKRNLSLENFLAIYESFVIRAIPNTKDLPRRYKIGVHSFEECQEFLAKNVPSGKEDKYSVFLTEHEPTNLAGVIISRPQDVLIEVAQSGLDELSHGKVTPSVGHFAQHYYNHFKSMRYNTKDMAQRQLMWRALQYLRKDLSSDSDLFTNTEFLKGYFEFVVTEKTSKIKFLDYKINENYLK